MEDESLLGSAEAGLGADPSLSGLVEVVIAPEESLDVVVVGSLADASDDDVVLGGEDVELPLSAVLSEDDVVAPPLVPSDVELVVVVSLPDVEPVFGSLAGS